MRRTIRLRALLLAALFVGVGTVAPMADALLFHQGGQAVRAHIETRDNPACHGERCVIPLGQLTSSGAPAVTPVATSLAPVADLVVARSAEAPRSTPLPDSRRSRAPPPSLA